MRDAALLPIEVGAVDLGWSPLSPLTDRISVSVILFHLLAGLAFSVGIGVGVGGSAPLNAGNVLCPYGSELGVTLLLGTLEWEDSPNDFFVSFGLSTEPGKIPPVLLPPSVSSPGLMPPANAGAFLTLIAGLILARTTDADWFRRPIYI